MAGNRIKGITVEIGGDTTKLQTALKGVNRNSERKEKSIRDIKVPWAFPQSGFCGGKFNFC